MYLMSPHSAPPASRGWMLSILVTLALAGCGKEEIRVYTTPKEQSASSAATEAQLPGASATSPIQWTVPEGWVEKPSGGMRVGSFSVAGKEGQQADISVIPLSGISGSDLDNVNRWRGQVSLEKLASEALPNHSEKVEIGDSQGLLVDMAGKDPQTQKPTRITGAILPVANTTWYFKMMGDDALVVEQKQAFKQFLKSIQFKSPQTAETPAAAPQEKTTSAKETAPSVPNSPTWDVPTGWEVQPATSMLLARFAVSDKDLGKGEVTVSSFPGDVGGLLANVNRWHNQIGLGPVSEADLSKVTAPLELNGAKATLVEIENKQSPASAKRLVVAVVPRGGQTWFYKLVGDDRLVAKEKAAFLKFVQSVRYPNA